MQIHPVILSGGVGSRLWPKSRAALPKQFLRLAGDHSLLQDTVLRVTGHSEFAPPLLVCNQEHRFLALENLKAIDAAVSTILLEPMGRNTAPAAAVAALTLTRDDPEAMMLVLPSDHFITDGAAFRAAVMQARSGCENGAIVTFGVKPAKPETGYGYIKQGEPLQGAANCYRVVRFVEKPALEVAQTMLREGGFFWNSGMFLFRARHFLEELKRLRPEMVESCAKALEQGRPDLEFFRLDEKAFAACPSDSIDYAVMEHITHAAMVPADMGWSDVGSWNSLWEMMDKTPEGNVVRGDVYTDRVTNTFVDADERMVAAIGVDDLVIVETADAVLVARKQDCQSVKDIVDSLKASGRSEHQFHRRVYRPWGYFESIDAGDRFQVKRIMVNPGARLSLQMHHHRAEHWVVVRGTAKVTRGEETVLLSENESTYIPLGTAHRLENPGKLPLHIVEVQSGAYLGEDDIVRLEDSYNRS